MPSPTLNTFWRVLVDVAVLAMIATAVTMMFLR